MRDARLKTEDLKVKHDFEIVQRGQRAFIVTTRNGVKQKENLPGWMA